HSTRVRSARCCEVLPREVNRSDPGGTRTHDQRIKRPRLPAYGVSKCLFSRDYGDHANVGFGSLWLSSAVSTTGKTTAAGPKPGWGQAPRANSHCPLCLDVPQRGRHGQAQEPKGAGCSTVAEVEGRRRGGRSLPRLHGGLLRGRGAEP